MKNLISGVLLLLLMVGISSCRDEFGPDRPGNNRNQGSAGPVMKTVRMTFGGDFITQSEEPLSRADDPNNYKAINVYRTALKSGAKEETYAYGIFQNINDLELNLITGFEYRFEATVLVDDVDKVAIYNNNAYREPFMKNEFESRDPALSNIPIADINKFHYAADDFSTKKVSYYLYQLRSGTTYVNTNGDIVGSNTSAVPTKMDYPRLKRYYGTLASFNPLTDGESVNIDMKYKSFGIRIDVVDVPFGTVKVEDVTKNNKNEIKTPQERLLFPGNLLFGKADVSDSKGNQTQFTSWQGLYSMGSMTAEQNSFTLKFTWQKGEGLSSPSFTQAIEVHPKMNKVLKLSVSGTENENKGGNIMLVMQDDTLQDEESTDVSYSDQ